MKILVVNQPRWEALAVTELDPHFFGSGPVVARFRPDVQGWEDARHFINRRYQEEQKEQRRNEN